MLSTQKNRQILQLLVAICLIGLSVVQPVRPASIWASSQSTIPSSESLAGCGGPIFPSSNESFEQEVVRLTNQVRLDNGLLPLKSVDSLVNAARFHATDMSEENFFSHTSYDRVNDELVESCHWGDRLSTYYSNAQWRSENIAAGYDTPARVVDGWMNSDGHRRNILSPNNWEIGVGYFQGSGSYRNYWVQDFGRRLDVYPVIINGETPTTDDGILTIHIYGEWNDVRLRVDQGEWSDWQPFALPLQWQLKAPAGEHRVEVEMRTESTGASASDTIYLTQDTAEPELNALPDSITFYYDPDDETASPDLYTIQPLAAAATPAYSWQVVADAPWLNITPRQGSSTEVVTLVPAVSGANGGSEQATVTVSLLKSDGTVVAEKVIAVSLAARGDTFAIFVPLISGK